MLPRPLIALLAAAAAIAGVAGPATAEDRPAPIQRTVTLSLPDQGMAVVPIDFDVEVRPLRGVRLVRTAVQVRTRDGFRTMRVSGLDAGGRADGSLVSNRPGPKEYRAVVLSPSGRVITTSPIVTVTWAPLTHAVSLHCDGATAIVDADVPCTIAVTPGVRLDDFVAILQIRGQTGWVNLESFAVPKSGKLTTEVAGMGVGPQDYRVLLLRDARVLAESPTVIVTYG
jgi:hypothetical protein